MDRAEREWMKCTAQEIISLSQDGNAFKKYFLEVFEDLCLKGLYEAFPMPNDEDRSEEAHIQRTRYQMACLHISANIDTIYKYTESPLESLFLCSLLLLNIRNWPFFFTVTSPIVADVFSSQMYALNQRIQRIQAKRRQQRRPPELRDMVEIFEALDDFKNIAPTFIDNHFEHIIGNKTTDFSQMLGYVLDGLPSSFHISLQPTFKTISVEGRAIRPDMLLWIPNQPKFKLIVECDGYAYHHDKETFAKDRIRDRVLQQHGYQIFRFSGQEVFSDPLYRANEFLEHLMVLAEEFDVHIEKTLMSMTDVYNEDEDESGDNLPEHQGGPQKKHTHTKKSSPQQKKRLRHSRKKQK